MNGTKKASELGVSILEKAIKAGQLRSDIVPADKTIQDIVQMRLDSLNNIHAANERIFDQIRNEYNENTSIAIQKAMFGFQDHSKGTVVVVDDPAAEVEEFKSEITACQSTESSND